MVKQETECGCWLLGSKWMAMLADEVEGEPVELAASSTTTAGHCCQDFQRWMESMTDIVQWVNEDCAVAVEDTEGMKWLLGIQKRDDEPSVECADEGEVA